MDGEISVGELHEMLDSGSSIRVVDIRSPSAFRRGHISGSENVPFAELTQRIESFNGSDHVIVACPHGQASVQAARLLASYEGFTGRVESLEPGITGWAQEYELAVSDETTTTDRGAGSNDGPESPF
jgi:rhodanese-related sulfurtransferase